MAISRAQLLKELLPGLNALFGLEYARYGEEHKEIYEVESSERSFEEETKLAGFGAAPVKNEGQGIAYDNAQEAWTARYNHETIALGFSITEEAVEDNLYDSLSSRYTKALARAMAYTKQVKGAAVLNNAFSGSYLYGDGKSLCATDHPLVNGATNSNRPTTGVDLNETSLENAVIQIAAWTDEKGLLIAAKPKKLVIPPALMFVATRLLETTQRVGTADNDINALKSNGSIPGGYTVNHFLTDTNAWFLLTDVPNGMKHFVRTSLDTKMDGDFDTGNIAWRLEAKRSRMEEHQEHRFSMGKNVRPSDRVSDQSNETAMQSVEMLKAVINGETYETVAAKFGKSRTAVERRIKAIATQVTKAVGIQGLRRVHGWRL